MSTQPKRLPKSILIAGIVGSALEWYDFLLYAYFAAIIAPIFFPAKTHFISLLLTFTVFALGFLVRPLGAIVIGHWGDVLGRRKAMIYTMILMTVPTVMIGLLPSYATWGIAAPILLTLIRCLQGFVVSGEIASAASFLIEHSHSSRRGYAGSLVMSSAFAGIVVGAGVATLFSKFMPPDILSSWGWRLPFLSAGLFGIIGLILRLRISESPEFIALPKTTEHSPFKLLIKHYWRPLLTGMGLTTVIGMGMYLLIAYFTTYLTEIGFTHHSAMLVNTLSITALVFLLIFAGILSDKYGKKPVFLVGIISMIVLIFPILWLLAQKTFFTALAAEILYVIALAPLVALIMSLLAELFPTQIRNTGSALSYNISLAIFGGTAPLVAISLTHALHSGLAPGIYLIVGALVSGVCLFLRRETF